MRLFKNREVTSAEQRFSLLELIACCVGFCTVGFVAALCISEYAKPFPEFLEVCIDKGVDIGIASFVSVYFVYRYDRRKAMRENSIRYLRDSKLMFEDAISITDNVDRINFLYDQALDGIEESQKLLEKLGFRSCKTLLHVLVESVNSSKEIGKHRTSGKRSDELLKECKDIIKSYNRVINDVVNK